MKAGDFQVEFIWVVSSDYISADPMGLEIRPLGCRHIITSNISKPADYLTEKSPKRLHDCGQWERLPITEKRKRESNISQASEFYLGTSSIDTVADG